MIMEEVLVMGAGHQGLAMAAHLSLNGIKTNIWNRSCENIKAINNTHEIFVSGVLNGIAHINKVSTNIEEVLAKLILVTVPANGHSDVAKILANYVDESFIVVLNPGRTFGILEFEHSLLESGCRSLPIIAETQTIIYTCRRNNNNSVHIYTLKQEVYISAKKKKSLSRVMAMLPSCLTKYLCPVDSWIKTSFGNVGMILHCLPVLMNTGWIENQKVAFKYYYEGITPTIGFLLDQLDGERIMIGNLMGTTIESTVQWLGRTYKVMGDTIYECIQDNNYYKEIDAPTTIVHRYIQEDVPCGLVSVESVGECYGCATPVTTLVIDLANLALGTDYRKIGRRIQKYNYHIDKK